MRTTIRAACITFALGLALLGAGASTLPPNADCLACHDGRQALSHTGAGDTPARSLRAVAPAAFAQSVHAKLACVACHTDISDHPAKGQAHAQNPAQPRAKVDCASCHDALWKAAQARGTAADAPGLERVAKNMEAYRASFHARPNADDASKPNASCDDCHDTHSFHVPAKGTAAYAQWRQSIPATCGTRCHEDQLEAYTGSVHGQEALQKHNPKAAVCTDCHSTHAIGNSSGDAFKLAVTAQCGSCHQENLASYKATYHGQISTLGYAYTAKCFNCHGSHDILRVADPQSKVHADNRLKTCQSCHNGKKDLALAPAGFISFQPHGNVHDFQRYPQMWVAWQIMLQLLVGTFGFFWLHTALWFYREYRERRAMGQGPRIQPEPVPAAWQGKHVRRFSPIWRLAHITFALSLMTLTLTGMPLFYPAAPWAPTLMHWLGGPHVAGSIHRVSAVIFAGVFFWHLGYIAWRIGRNWKDFKLFGPNSLVPNLQDGRDMLAMFKWFFGKGPRPRFDRWTYWEKFDYWAPFWGVTIIGVSGLVMWLPNVFAAFLPGWIFNVAAIFHAEEAFLAVVFLFTVHFFNNHFRPDKFPLEVVMFTGSFSLEEFQREHALEYQRLLKSGELERYLVDAPSARHMAVSKLLGFVLIAIGLGLLTMVGIGFFTSH